MQNEIQATEAVIQFVVEFRNLVDQRIVRVFTHSLPVTDSPAGHVSAAHSRVVAVGLAKQIVLAARKSSGTRRADPKPRRPLPG